MRRKALLYKTLNRRTVKIGKRDKPDSKRVMLREELPGYPLRRKHLYPLKRCHKHCKKKKPDMATRSRVGASGFAEECNNPILPGRLLNVAKYKARQLRSTRESHRARSR